MHGGPLVRPLSACSLLFEVIVPLRTSEVIESVQLALSFSFKGLVKHVLYMLELWACVELIDWAEPVLQQVWAMPLCLASASTSPRASTLMSKAIRSTLIMLVSSSSRIKLGGPSSIQS